MTLDKPTTTSPTISGRIQFCEVTFIFFWIFLFLSLPSQDRIGIGKFLGLVSEDLVCIRQMADCCHQLVHVALVRGCGHL